MSFPHFGRRYDQAELHSAPRTRPGRDRVRERITSAFVRFATDALDLGDRHLALLLDSGFSGMGAELARQARRFDPQVAASDILQASRNAWTACGLQVLLGEAMRLTPAIFAYSMLYPYSDNYLDDPGISRPAKLEFSRRFGRRLAGDQVPPANSREAAIWRLIGLIEDQYARADYPRVFGSLSAIHRSQENSIRLLRRNVPAEEVDVLRLSFDKGGNSVLADAYLAAGSLRTEDAEFTFQWGVALQLGDDLQDVRKDLGDDVLTLFSQSARPGPLDGLTSRSLHFAAAVLRRLELVGAPGSETLKDLVRRSTLSLLVRAAGEASEFHTPEYLAQLQAYSPFRFSVLNRRRKELARMRGSLVRLFEAFLSAEEDEPPFPLLPSSLMPRF